LAFVLLFDSHSGLQKSKGKATAADSMKTDLSTTVEDSQATVAAKSRPKAAKGKKAAAAAIASAKLEASANAAPLLAPNGTASSSKALPSITKAGYAPSARKNTSVSVASRSRSTSVMPGITSEHAAPTPSSSVGEDKVEKGDKQEEEEEEAVGNDDNRLYCVCKTKYDQERFMIACDR
jgi:COMPASS component SPP1